MSEIQPIQGPILFLDIKNNESQKVLKALASDPRLRVLDLLRDKVCNISEIAEALDIPLSTTNLHVSALEEAGLLITQLQPGSRGLQKVCARAYDIIIIKLPHGEQHNSEHVINLSMPVGAYADCKVTPTCGLANQDKIIGLFDDPASFFEPDHYQAQLVWFQCGFVEYRFPNRASSQLRLAGLEISLELCSEAPLYQNDWPSDITLWVNGIEVGTWTCPGDFGGQRGLLTPGWWEDWNTQYGLLKVWQVKEEGSFIDGTQLSDISITDLNIEGSEFISMRIGVKSNAVNVGGINIFGKQFGNYPQDINFKLRYVP